jgi:alpha-tubulin suppressor-like RCC1 family protein
MKFYFLFCVCVVFGCRSTPPPSTDNAPVVIPTSSTTVGPEPTDEATEQASPRKPRLQISIGDNIVCLRVDVSLRCWRRSAGAQVPIMAMMPPIAGIGSVSDVAVGMQHVCAIADGGKVFCWGGNAHGQLGARRSDEHVDEPVRAEGIEGAVAITAGMMHSCALLGDGRVSCWGWNAEGQTGSDTEYASEVRELVVPEVVAGISEVTSLSAGRDQTCAKTKTGWWCWGRSYMKSQTAARGSHHNQPAKVDELQDMQQLALKDETACGLFMDGHIGCWGSGAFSILPSRPLRADTPLPVILPAARSFAMGEYHGCAILQNGRISCFGWNNYGELGRTPQPDYEPHESGMVDGLPAPVDSLSLGLGASCAILRDGQMWCWGIAPHLPLEHGAGSGTPVRVPIDS